MKIERSWLNRNIVGFGLTSFFSDFCFEMTTPILPFFIEQLVGPSYGAFALGLIEGVANGLAACTRIIAGRIADKAKFYKPYLIAGYGLMPIFISLIGTATSIWLVLFYKTAAWIFRAMREPIRDTWLSKIVASSYYGRAFGFNRALDSTGAIVGPLITFFILNKVSLRTIFFVAIIPGIFSVLSLIILTSEKNKAKEPSKEKHHSCEQLKRCPPTLYISFLLCSFLALVISIKRS
ncbi:MFS transporter [Candidatus Dependentiae bacterium]|nr:MFS transporter [Candidatus Dependentiae bacterium]